MVYDPLCVSLSIHVLKMLISLFLDFYMNGNQLLGRPKLSFDLVYRFAGQTLSSKSLVLVTVKLQESSQVTVSVNCEKMVIGSMLLNEIRSHLRS